MEGGGGGSSSSSCLLAFGDNSNGLCPIMMMPSVTSNPNTSNMCFPPPPINNNQNQNGHTNCAGSAASMMLDGHNTTINTNTGGTGCYFMESSSRNNNSDEISSLKSKIMSHPHYLRLLASYVNCQKIGAPPEVVVKLEEACVSVATMRHTNNTSSLGEDPALDQFMEAYCEMLTKYEQELAKPFKEATLFLSRIECQFKALTLASSDNACGEAVAAMERNGPSEEDFDVNNHLIDPQAEDRELKSQLLRKYSGYLGSLKRDFMKKRKKGKLPKEARQQLLDWWSRHYKWPYPSEPQKISLAESTGLDQKQINNWFINQRKRHWKPSEDMQFVVMDAAHPHYYVNNVLDPFSMDVSHTLF